MAQGRSEEWVADLCSAAGTLALFKLGDAAQRDAVLVRARVLPAGAEAHERVGEWTEAWVLKLRALGCKASTVSVYVNGVISVSSFALSLVAEPELCPTHELLTLRKQAESISKQERLFEAKHKHWLLWEDAQKARVACIEKYNAATSAEQRKAPSHHRSAMAQMPR